jgi:hypothetical protein
MNKNDIDSQAEREGKALHNALKPNRSNQQYNRIRLKRKYNADIFTKLFKEK